jgi:heat shock protein HslJ
VKITGQIAGLIDGATEVKITDSSGAVVVEQPVLLSQTETSDVFNWSSEVVVPTRTAHGLAIISTEFISAEHSDFDFTSMREIEIAKKPINQSLDGTWQLVSTLDQDGYTVAIPEGIQIQMTLNEGKITGRSACNSFTGSYTAAGPDSIMFSPLATTRMACQESSMFIEFNQLRAFSATTSYIINSKNELRLFDVGDGTVATYMRVASK